MEFTLTKNQQACLDQIDSSYDNFLVHGKPGVGKSVLINALIEMGRKFYHIAAPTGLAALNINGRTLHSLFRLPVSEGIISPDFNKISFDEYSDTWKLIQYQLKHLIIDEISMVRADTFDYIDRILRRIKKRDVPFGGVQIICVGDFFQLPPVTKKTDLKELKDAGYASPFVFDAKAFKGFKVLQLDEVLRQKGDTKFISILHSARTGELSAKDMVALNQQVGANPDDLKIKLTGTNSQADQINMGHLRGLPGEPTEFHAENSGTWPAFPCETVLQLKVGAQVMVKLNKADVPPNAKKEDYQNSKVVNGTLGIVVEINDKSTGKPPHVVIESAKGERSTIYIKTWERKVRERIDGEWVEKVVASFTQMPLALAWAISMHKSQGQSFDRVHIDGSKVFAPGQMYVALSRARTLAGLSLEDRVSRDRFWADKDVMKFAESL